MEKIYITLDTITYNTYKKEEFKDELLRYYIDSIQYYSSINKNIVLLFKFSDNCKGLAKDMYYRLVNSVNNRITLNKEKTYLVIEIKL